MVRHHVVRRIIDRCTHDLIQTTLAAIEKAGVGSVADVRAAGRRLVGYSPEMAEHVRELKEFLFSEMYRHYRVVRMGDKAARVLRDLFESLVREPRQLPPRFQEQIERDGVHRVVCDYIAGMTDRFALQEHRKLFNPDVRV
jgi:dGTPase